MLIGTFPLLRLWIMAAICSCRSSSDCSSLIATSRFFITSSFCRQISSNDDSCKRVKRRNVSVVIILYHHIRNPFRAQCRTKREYYLNLSHMASPKQNKTKKWYGNALSRFKTNESHGLVGKCGGPVVEKIVTQDTLLPSVFVYSGV